MSSTFSIVLAMSSWLPGRSGAMEKPQLPPTTVVTPWKQEGVSAGSQNDLGVVVGVDVDEAGGDDAAVRVEGAVTLQVLADVGDPPAGDGHVGPPRGRAGAVDHRPASDDQRVAVVRRAHLRSPMFGCAERPERARDLLVATAYARARARRPFAPLGSSEGRTRQGEPARWTGSPSRRSSRSLDQSARPWRSSRPGVAPVQSPSSKVTSPLTMMSL